MVKEEIKRLVEAKGARVGVIGLGYVGLPLAVEFARKGLRAVGFEVDARKAELINRGESYIGDVDPGTLAEVVSSERLHATTDFDELAACDAIIICVPTPLRKTKEPDISYILAAAGEIRKRLRRGQLVILESTTYPGTTDEVLLPMFEEAGLKLDSDFLLAFSPERVDPGNPQFHTDNIPKVVGGCTDDSTEVAAALYGLIVKDVHAVSSARVAEAAKLLENTFRAVNIGMANEMARLCYHLGIDTWEVIRAAATKPFGFMPFYPGPGIGGHCIPLDPHYLSWKARQHGFDSRFIGLAEEVNSRMPEHVVALVTDALNEERKSLKGARVLILGVAYKKDIDDVRESPALSIIDRLRAKGAEVRYHDPFVSGVRFDDAHTQGGGDPLQSVELADAELERADCTLIVTDHSGVDYDRVCRLSRLIVDTRNALSRDQRRQSRARIVRLRPDAAMLKVINVVGARPNFMKVAPIVEAMRRRGAEFSPLVVHTGQHYDARMSDDFFRDLGLPAPEVHLGVGSGSHAQQTAAVMQRFEPVVLEERPDWVLVVGDVNSTLACALVCSKLGVRVAHVEAGLRSRDRAMPEEINRLLTDQLSDLLLTPSKDADRNLLAEGIPPERIRLVGNVMIDSLLGQLERAAGSRVREGLGVAGGDYAVVTLHRPSNVDDAGTLRGILRALARIGRLLPVVFPAHPRTGRRLEEFGLTREEGLWENIRLTEPLGYLDFLRLYSGARLVLTDSGGLQEETTALGIPCLTLRENTERPVTVELGTNRVVGTDEGRIVSEAEAALRAATGKEPPRVPPLWDGRSADRVLDALLERTRELRAV